MSEQMNDKRRLVLMILLAIIFVVSSVGAAYSYFSANMSGNEADTTITLSGGTLEIHMDGGNQINLTNIFPREEALETKKFTIIGNNNTTINMPYHLDLVITENTFTDNAIMYRLTSVNTSDTGTVIPTTTTRTGIENGSRIVSLGSGVFDQPGTNMVHTYHLAFYFPSTGEVQNENQGRVFRAHIGISEEAGGVTTTTSTTTAVTTTTTTTIAGNWVQHNCDEIVMSAISHASLGSTNIQHQLARGECVPADSQNVRNVRLADVQFIRSIMTSDDAVHFGSTENRNRFNPVSFPSPETANHLHFGGLNNVQLFSSPNNWWVNGSYNRVSSCPVRFNTNWCFWGIVYSAHWEYEILEPNY